MITAVGIIPKVAPIFGTAARALTEDQAERLLQSYTGEPLEDLHKLSWNVLTARLAGRMSCEFAIYFAQECKRVEDEIQHAMPQWVKE